MTRNPSRFGSSRSADSDPKPSSSSSSGTAMRIIVPLQGVVQGRGGLVLGSLIPCALFYFFQLYFKTRNRSSPPSSSSSSSGDLNTASAGGIHRSQSRSLLSPRGSLAPAAISARATAVARSQDSAYYAGMKRCAEDPYDAVSNPNGVIQLGLAENQLSLDLIGEWLHRNLEGAMKMDGEGGGLSISGLATYQPFDGIMDLKIVVLRVPGEAVFDRDLAWFTVLLLLDRSELQFLLVLYLSFLVSYMYYVYG